VSEKVRERGRECERGESRGGGEEREEGVGEL